MIEIMIKVLGLIFGIKKIKLNFVQSASTSSYSQPLTCSEARL